MISELTDEEILDFLMTNDFDGDYKPEEFKYLLIKWRYFYRIMSGKLELHRTDSNFEILSLNEKIKFLEKEIENLKVLLSDNQNQIDTFKSRKLTLSERIKGKINFEDEN